MSNVSESWSKVLRFRVSGLKSQTKVFEPPVRGKSPTCRYCYLFVEGLRPIEVIDPIKVLQRPHGKSKICRTGGQRPTKTYRAPKVRNQARRLTAHRRSETKQSLQKTYRAPEVRNQAISFRRPATHPEDSGTGERHLITGSSARLRGNDLPLAFAASKDIDETQRDFDSLPS